MQTTAFAADVRRGLESQPKHLDPRYFYDALGSALFAAICELPEYYVTRAERSILDRCKDEIAAAFGPVERLVELGSGNAHKTQTIIAAIATLRAYRPIDVDAGILEMTEREITARFPGLAVQPHQGDFHDIVSIGTIAGKTVVLFLGSSIGNLDHPSAAALLRDVRRIMKNDDALFIGFDLAKDKAVLEPAYNDALGVTAAFNLNVLARINRELGGTFRLESFSHRAFFNEKESRIEMHLVAKEAQRVRIGDLEVSFGRGESIHTENSYKYDEQTIERLAREAGFRVERRWTDDRGWFADVLLRPEPVSPK